MEIELAAVRRALRDEALTDVELVRSGIGKAAIVRAIELACGARRTDLVILAGACGALRDVDDVPSISRIVDEHGGAWVGGAGMREDGVVLVAVDRVVSTPADKRRLAESSGASIVDMESHAFASACVRLGVAWAVVRGVSDTPNETLPERVLHWIAPDGRMRPIRAVLDLARRPALIPHIRAVLARSRRVLPQVGRSVAELCRRRQAAPSAPAAQAAPPDSFRTVEK